MSKKIKYKNLKSSKKQKYSTQTEMKIVENDMSKYLHSKKYASQEQSKQPLTDETGILRKLDIKQRNILELFTEYEEITSAQAGSYLEISSQSARLLLNKWGDDGFLKIANPAKKNRTYGLTVEYEALKIDTIARKCIQTIIKTFSEVFFYALKLFIRAFF